MNVMLSFIVSVSLFLSVSLAAEAPYFNVLSTYPHTVQLLEESTASLEARLALIENAQQYIILETFIYDLDIVGSWFAQALMEKKKRDPHVRIQILVDSLPMKKTLNSFHAEEFKRLGIELKLYNQSKLFAFSELHVRNHIKLLASESEFITGGRNVARDYFSLSPEDNFIDRDVLVKGPTAAAATRAFAIFWSSDKSTPPVETLYPNMDDYRTFDNKIGQNYLYPLANDDPKDVYQYQMAVAQWEKNKRDASIFMSAESSSDQDKELLSTMRAAGKRALERQPVFTINNIRFVSDGPDWVKHKETITGTVLLETVQKTEKTFTLENGYIIPDQENWKIFKTLMKTGKEITILTNSRKASRREFVVNSITQAYARLFAQFGAKVYLYSGEPMADDENPNKEITLNSRFNTHSKTYVIDGNRCMIGTANFDSRSLRRMNAEMALLIDDTQFCKHVESMIFKRIRNGHAMDVDGNVPPDINTNEFESFPQLLITLVLPVIRLFERWF